MVPMRRSRLHVIVHEHVQGVGFRWSTSVRMEALGVDGSAHNLVDGTVEVRASGDPDALAALLDWLRGPGTPGYVTGVEVL